jgi:methylated-DNA-[protein]-cysteine S-methyltransferase
MIVYQAKLAAPFGMLGIRCDEAALLGIDFLPVSDEPQAPVSVMAEAVCEQLMHYFADPDASFSIPLHYTASAHRQKVWLAMLSIPRGETRSYGEMASELHSCAQAVGQACGANPIPIVIPCHRVVGKSGLGGFMHQAEGSPLNIKRWLLAHEQR